MVGGGGLALPLVIRARYPGSGRHRRS
jgi:hypothetical protein